MAGWGFKYVRTHILTCRQTDNTPQLSFKIAYEASTISRTIQLGSSERERVFLRNRPVGDPVTRGPA